MAEIVELLCCGGVRTANASSAAVFRLIQAHTAKDETITLIMDEMEVLRERSERAEQLREVLNAGYRRGQHVIRCEATGNNKFEVREFNVYCPKALVLIGSLNDTLADRCIPIAMRRRRSGEQLERFFPALVERQAKRLRKLEGKWAEASRATVKRRSRDDVPFLEDREAELWSPLFAVCRVASPDRVEELQGVALRISKGKHAEEPADLGILLLRDIRAIFDDTGEQRMSSALVCGQLCRIEESPWLNWSNGRGIDARELARKLRPFGIAPRNVRIDGQILKGYERADFEQTWATYLPRDLSATPLQANTDAGSSDFFIRYANGNVAAGMEQKANKNAGCSGVADTGGIEEEL